MGRSVVRVPLRSVFIAYNSSINESVQIPCFRLEDKVRTNESKECHLRVAKCTVYTSSQHTVEWSSRSKLKCDVSPNENNLKIALKILSCF